MKCDYCHEKFSQKENLQKHMENIHNVKGDIMQCHICNEVLMCLSGFGETGLKFHIKNSHPLSSVRY